MREDFLGDSYDIVKCFWRTSLEPIASLYAHPRFIPFAIRRQYTTVTTIPILDAHPEGRFGILLDPDTGVPLPTRQLVHATAKHAPLPFIVEVNEMFRPDCMICFDQSYHRSHEPERKEQMEAKREFLLKRGLSSFYYVSHAPFLFMAEQPLVLESVRGHLISLGIPKNKFSPLIP